jgi:membrane-bound lytic murein transglycosylase D
MMLKTNLLGSLLFMLAFHANAFDNKGKKLFDQHPSVQGNSLMQGASNITDSIINLSKPSPARSINRDTLMPAKGFNDLFEKSTEVESAAKYTAVRLNPKAMSFVQDYMQKQTTNLMKLKDWGRPYFNMMDAVLIQHGLPKELKYLAVIESRLKSGAVSWAGAVGPWQFMPGTARLFGLKVTKGRDERTDYVKSTHAAAKYLKSLYNEFGDWLLVIAAYNGGPGVVYNAMKKSKSKNFWDLQYYLPAESRTHVKKFIGTHYIFEGQGGITTLTKKETSEQVGIGKGQVILRNLTNSELENSASITISGKYHSTVISKYVLMDQKEFDRYNPNFDRVISTAENKYELKLPANKMELFNSHKFQILEESINVLLEGGNVRQVKSSNENNVYAVK